MKLSNLLLGFYLPMILTTVLSSPVTENQRNDIRKCGFDDSLLNTTSLNRFKRSEKTGNAWENRIVTWK